MYEQNIFMYMSEFIEETKQRIHISIYKNSLFNLQANGQIKRKRKK